MLFCAGVFIPKAKLNHNLNNKGCADSVVLRAHCECTTLAVVDLPASRLLVKVGRRVFVAITVSATAIGQAR